jgi:ABC-type branched-subunit amino acid transport system substrate-binding protein
MFANIRASHPSPTPPRVQRPRSRRSRALCAVAAAGLVLPLSACGTSEAGGGGSTLKVGYIAPLSGPAALYAGGFTSGVESAVKDHGRSGGWKIKLTKGDDASDPATSTQVCQRFVNQDHVDLIVAGQPAANAQACRAVAAVRKIPYVSFSTGATEFCFPNMWNYGPSPKQAALPLIEYLLSHGSKRFYLMGTDSASPKATFAIVKAQIEAKGGTVAGTGYEPLGTSDFSPDISKIVSSGADTVFSAVVAGDNITYHKQFAANAGTERLTQGDMQMVTKTARALGSASAGVISAGPSDPADRGAANAAYLAALKTTAPNVNPGDAVLSYQGMMLVTKAIDTLATGKKPSSAQLGAALSAATADTPSGKVTAAANRYVTMPMRIWKVGSNGSASTVLNTVPSADPAVGCKR